MIKKLVIISKDKLGLLADISYILAKEKINLESIDANAVENKAIITLGVLSAQYKKAKEALKRNKYKILSEKSFMIQVKDKPGMFAELTKRLTDARINILNCHAIGKQDGYIYVSINVNKPKHAKVVLEDVIISATEEDEDYA